MIWVRERQFISFIAQPLTPRLISPDESQEQTLVFVLPVQATPTKLEMATAVGRPGDSEPKRIEFAI